MALQTSRPTSPGSMGRQEDIAQQIEAAKLTITSSEIYLSVPPPAVVEAYLPHYPDAANKFFEWAEAESAHRRKLDEKLVESQVQDSRLGLVFGLLISLAALGVAAFAAWLKQLWAAGIIGGGTIVSLARAFIVGKHFLPRRQNTKNKEKG